MSGSQDDCRLHCSFGRTRQNDAAGDYIENARRFLDFQQADAGEKLEQEAHASPYQPEDILSQQMA